MKFKEVTIDNQKLIVPYEIEQDEIEENYQGKQNTEELEKTKEIETIDGSN